ncbi:HEAT repeat domain-containing protein [bacterium]|nr:HEAT repeat domain-containing protein [bacterium]MBU1994599.1 HEAT repeat domain-containing protein [bacterium]
MAILKTHTKQTLEAYPIFSTLEEAIDFFNSNTEFEKKSYAICNIAKFKGGMDFLISALANETTNKEISTVIATTISNADPQDVPIEALMNLLKLKNAYIRNLAMSTLSYFGTAMKEHLFTFLKGNDSNLRIYAINILGDVNFPESRKMLTQLLQKEENLNVSMTAVDYLREIGELEDIPLLESLKKRFSGDVYAEFALQQAIDSIKG